MDDALIRAVNSSARAAPWLLGLMYGYATYGVALFAAVLIAFAWIYIAAHYPHDVVAGLVLGATVVLAGWALLRKLVTTLVLLAEPTPLRPLVTTAPPPGASPAAIRYASADTGTP